jgi:hypothetical protein
VPWKTKRTDTGSRDDVALAAKGNRPLLQATLQSSVKKPV